MKWGVRPAAWLDVDDEFIFGLGFSSRWWPSEARANAGCACQPEQVGRMPGLTASSVAANGSRPLDRIPLYLRGDISLLIHS